MYYGPQFTETSADKSSVYWQCFRVIRKWHFAFLVVLYTCRPRSSDAGTKKTFQALETSSQLMCKLPIGMGRCCHGMTVDHVTPVQDPALRSIFVVPNPYPEVAGSLSVSNQVPPVSIRAGFLVAQVCMSDHYEKQPLPHSHGVQH